MKAILRLGCMIMVLGLLMAPIQAQQPPMAEPSQAHHPQMTGASVGLPMRHQFQRPVLLSGVIADKFLNDGIPYIEVQQPGTAGRRGGRVGASVFVPISALSADDLAMLRLEIGQVVEVEGFSTSVPAGAQTVEVLVPLAFSAGDVRVEVPLDMAALMPGGTPAAQPMSVGSMPMMPAMMEMMGSMMQMMGSMGAGMAGPGGGGMMGGMGMDMTALANARPFDKAFIEQMILHHQGAITMADLALANAEHPEIKTLAESIKAAQSTEITQMQEWYRTWYGTEVPTPQGGMMGSMAQMMDLMQQMMTLMQQMMGGMATPPAPGPGQ